MITITNLSTAPNDVNPMTLGEVHVTLSCGVRFNEGPGPPPGTAPNCPQPQPGVFALSATGTGRAGSACAGTTFAIAVIDPPTGKVSFTPNAPVMLPPSTFPPPGPGDSCLIDFTFNVSSAPTIDCEPASSGNQTCHTTLVEGTVDGLFASGSQSPLCGITVFPPVAPVCAASPLTPPVPPGPPVTPVQQAAGGTASLEAARGCVRRKLDVSVTGGEIAKVTFNIDGERRAADSSAPFGARIKTRSLSAGTHNLSAQVKFTAASGTPDRTLKRKLVRCSPPKPKFTG